MKKITVFVDEDGNLHADFSGFSGRSCEPEEEKLRKVLAELGLAVKPENVVKKSDARIQAEAGQNISDRDKRGIKQ